MKLICKSSNGQITFCPCANLFHLEFGNLLLTLSYEELKQMHGYVCSIDHEHYLNLNKDSFNRRKLLLNIGARKMYFCLNSSEFLELNDLLSLRKKPGLLNNSTLVEQGIALN
ncbi:DUF6686 family protein [Natronoflexus pectinivorans]|uniref:Uncharacterized protein n=1 Tax=Natronoflexus pectinivorans TaxID=682526 RepID=A0A4R2GD99_9BACT|nr:DUF6686 family protein [Natronoflexus pectinivorans]TCO06055.1 hypothetical protein EV194_11437 [Natronoflexus pectinivorans]